MDVKRVGDLFFRRSGYDAAMKHPTTMTTAQTPAKAGLAMPAEWRPHDATWLAWPHNHDDWPGKCEPIPWLYGDIIRLLAQGERVHLLVQPGKDNARRVREVLSQCDANLAHVTLHEKRTDRIWMRDSGGIFVTGRGGAAGGVVDFKFNAWAKYDNNANDDRVPETMAEVTGCKRFVAYAANDAGEYQRLVLEGGSIDVNGAGCVLTTEECLLSTVQQRNPGLSRERVEQALCDHLGVQKVLWLDRGIAGDDTHGHVDDTARFVNAQTIVICITSDKSDANYAPMRENLRRLKRMRDAKGKPFNIVELPLPEPTYFDGQRLPASYANFYIANAAVLVPVFNDPNDLPALKVLEACFKDRPIVPVYCRDLVWGLGTLHCMTQQQPELPAGGRA